MINYRLIISPFAEEDLQISCYWYNIQNEGLGNEFLFEIEEKLEKIKLHPKHFPFAKNKIRKALVNRFPFIIFFYISSDFINVFAILHSSRNPKRWIKRTHQ